MTTADGNGQDRLHDGEVQHFVDVLPSKCQRKNRIGETVSLTGFTANRDGIEVLQIRAQRNRSALGSDWIPGGHWS